MPEAPRFDFVYRAVQLNPALIQCAGNPDTEYITYDSRDGESAEWSADLRVPENPDTFLCHSVDVVKAGGV